MCYFQKSSHLHKENGVLEPQNQGHTFLCDGWLTVQLNKNGNDDTPNMTLVNLLIKSVGLSVRISIIALVRHDLQGLL